MGMCKSQSTNNNNFADSLKRSTTNTNVEFNEKAFKEMFGDKLIDNKQTQLDTSELKDSTIIGILFSASWCPPCKIFVPKLITYYNEVNSTGNKLKIVFISSDKNKTEFYENFKTHPWLAIDFTDVLYIDKLKRLFNVKGIPKLVLVKKDFSLISTEGKELIQKNYSIEALISLRRNSV